jgi:hypothetical protein
MTTLRYPREGALLSGEIASSPRRRGSRALNQKAEALGSRLRGNDKEALDSRLRGNDGCAIQEDTK